MYIYFIMQTTIVNPVSCFGIGVHSGSRAQITIKPGKANTGIVFVRTDIKSENNYIEAIYSNVSDTSLGTTIKNSSNVQVSTIEHLMAAIWGCGVDNLIVEIDGPEVPIMDGSSKPFVFMIEYAGKQLQKARKKHLKVLKSVKIYNKDSEIICYPSDSLEIDLTIDFDNPVIGKQVILFDKQTEFKTDIANARTFGFLRDLDYLKSKGLAQGASLDNAIGIDNNLILNHEGLRYKDEFARHKLLDFVGDFFTAQCIMICSFKSYKAGHSLHNEFLRKLFSDPTAYELL